MDLDDYAEKMLDFYTRRVDPADDHDARWYADDYERIDAQEGHHGHELAMVVRQVFGDHDVLELAAGMGHFTRNLVKTARSVVATNGASVSSVVAFVMHPEVMSSTPTHSTVRQ